MKTIATPTSFAAESYNLEEAIQEAQNKLGVQLAHWIERPGFSSSISYQVQTLATLIHKNDGEGDPVILYSHIITLISS